MRCHFIRNCICSAGRRAVVQLRRSQTGFTLIETVVSALLVALIAGAAAEALIANAHFSGDQRRRSQANAIAQQDQERLRGLSAQQLSALNQTRAVTLDGTVFTVTSTAVFLNSSGSASCGSSGSGAGANFRTTSDVDWVANRRSDVIEESIITPPAGGVLVTQVVDQTNAPLSGVGVTASGADYASGVTDSTGCAAFAGLASGSYNVTLAKTGYVDPSGNTSPPNLTPTVSATGTTILNNLMMGLAGSMNANFTTTAFSGSSLATISNQQADALSWYGAGSSTSMTSYASNDPSGLAALIPTSGMVTLFPFAFTGPSYTSNYQVWAGKCLQMEPPTGTDKFNVAPGSSQTAAVKEPALNVVVNYATSGRVIPADVKLTFASTSGTACTETWSAPIAANANTSTNGALAYPGQPFASTATTGTTASASGQTGTYSICADYTPSGGSSHLLTVSSVTNTSFTALNPVTITIPSSNSARGTCP